VIERRSFSRLTESGALSLVACDAPNTVELMGADKHGIAIYCSVRDKGNGREADFPALSPITLAGA
jgi:hypothetical protein